LSRPALIRCVSPVRGEEDKDIVLLARLGQKLKESILNLRLCSILISQFDNVIFLEAAVLTYQEAIDGIGVARGIAQVTNVYITARFIAVLIIRNSNHQTP